MTWSLRRERFDQTLLGQGEKGCRLLALHTREIGEKGVESAAFHEVIEKGLNRHTGAGKARGAVHLVGIHADDLIEARFLRDAHFLTKEWRTDSRCACRYGPTETDFLSLDKHTKIGYMYISKLDRRSRPAGDTKYSLS